MISDDTMQALEDPQRNLGYILGTRMRRVNEVKREVLSRAGRYKEVVPEGKISKDPAPLKVKEVWVEDHRYIVCLNVKQARRDAEAREAMVEALKEQLKKGPKSLIGNRGYRKYLKVTGKSVTLDPVRIEAETRFDGKWVLKTNTQLSAEQVALKVGAVSKKRSPTNTKNSGRSNKPSEI